MKSVDPDSVTELRTRNPERLLGVSPESIYLTLYSAANNTELTEELRPVFRANTLASNLSFNYQTATDLNRTLCRDFGLLDQSGISDLGRLLLASNDPISNIRIAVANRSPRLQTYLLEFTELESEVIDRSDLESLAKDSRDKQLTIPLLHSLGYAEIFPAGAIPDVELILETVDQPKTDINDAQTTVHLIQALTELNTKQAKRIASEIHDTSPSEIHDANETAVIHTLARMDPTYTLLSVFREATEIVIEDIQNILSNLHTGLMHTTHETVTVTGESISYPSLISQLTENTDGDQTRSESIARFISTVSDTKSFGQVPVSVLEDVLATEPYNIYQALVNIDGISCSIEAGVFHINSVPPIAQQNSDSLSKEFLEATTTRLSNNRESLRELDSVVFAQTAPQYDRLVSDVFRDIDQDAVAPTYFAYTLPDPDELGEETMEEYVNGSDGLMKERAKLKRWQRKERPDDAKRYTELTDQVISRGLSHELDEQVLRIMTPYDDDMFSEFASQFRSLLREGYELRLVTRHTRKRWQWERLRDNLLGELTTNRNNVSIRTYSRYKEYHHITPNTDESDLDEFGIHAKLQIIGNPEEGAALLGSANLMENSYHWNPECGAYSENSNFVAAAISFFDHVWDLSAPDTIDLENLQQIPERSYHPSYYT